MTKFTERDVRAIAELASECMLGEESTLVAGEMLNQLADMLAEKELGLPIAEIKFCNGCGNRLLLSNIGCEDGCPCNSKLGVNFIPTDCKTCGKKCSKPEHHWPYVNANFSMNDAPDSLRPAAQPRVSAKIQRFAIREERDLTHFAQLMVSDDNGPWCRWEDVWLNYVLAAQESGR